MISPNAKLTRDLRSVWNRLKIEVSRLEQQPDTPAWRLIAYANVLLSIEKLRLDLEDLDSNVEWYASDEPGYGAGKGRFAATL